MEVVNSLVVIIIAMAVGLVVGFEIGMNTMRRRIMDIIEKTIVSAQKAADKNRIVTLERWKALVKSLDTRKEDTKTEEKEQEQNGIQSERDI